ncbi:MAG: DNA recombination protein RmuC, partial [Alphaproteobacteria bacterium]|nr:DNA recombination protein RmuC [Alphaproteobacteria bacterium]
MDVRLILGGAVIALIFAVLGWLLGGRSAVAIRVERDKYLEDFRKSIRDLEEALRERDVAKLDLAALQATQSARDDAHVAQIEELRANREALTAQFSEIGAKTLAAAQSQFIEQARAQFTSAQEVSGQKLKALLEPVEATLKRYEDGLKSVEKERVDAYAGLREAVDAVRQGQGQVRDETAKLVNVLRASPKARGRWGEQQLRNVLEMAGLSEHADFATEVHVDTDDGRSLRPDVIVRLPGGKQLIID